jgi:hypothetical protein
MVSLSFGSGILLRRMTKRFGGPCGSPESVVDLNILAGKTCDRKF